MDLFSKLLHLQKKHNIPLEILSKQEIEVSGQDLGGQVAANKKVLKIDYQADPIKIYTKNQEFTAKKLVVTVGK